MDYHTSTTLICYKDSNNHVPVKAYLDILDKKAQKDTKFKNRLIRLNVQLKILKEFGRAQEVPFVSHIEANLYKIISNQDVIIFGEYEKLIVLLVAYENTGNYEQNNIFQIYRARDFNKQFKELTL